MGAMAELASRIPIRTTSIMAAVQPACCRSTSSAGTSIRSVAKARHTVAKAGDVLPVKVSIGGIVTSAREIIRTALPGGGRPNRHCAGFTPHAVNPVSGQPVGNTEDEQSVGSHISFGKFRALYLADFPWNREFEIMCPNNRLGTVDFLLVSRHGQHSSNSEALVHALRPRVAVINNGTERAGSPRRCACSIRARA